MYVVVMFAGCIGIGGVRPEDGKWLLLMAKLHVYLARGFGARLWSECILLQDFPLLEMRYTYTIISMERLEFQDHSLVVIKIFNPPKPNSCSGVLS
jgi:hypothetical protein